MKKKSFLSVVLTFGPISSALGASDAINKLFHNRGEIDDAPSTNTVQEIERGIDSERDAEFETLAPIKGLTFSGSSTVESSRNDSQSGNQTGSRVVGGDTANPGEYPYFVEMGSCGGALIAPDVVLFAAHCTNGIVNQQISIGAYKKRSPKEGAQGRFCERYEQDPRYGTGGSPQNYDFALCKLDRPVEIDESRIKLELNVKENVPSGSDSLHVMGFGRLKAQGDTPDYLQTVQVQYINNSECNKRYRGSVRDSMMCAGILDVGGKDACQGDSGGPLIKRTFKQDGTIVDTHVGVVSWGTGCAEANYPGVYARTSKAADWIQKTMCKTFQSVAKACNNPPPPKCGGTDVTIQLTTDQYGSETSWTLRDDEANLVKFRKYIMNNYQQEVQMCLRSNTCYTWEIEDGFGDGMCTTSGCGSYSLKLNNERNEVMVTGDGKFRQRKSETFCTPDISSTETPTKSPSKSPTISPTHVPTLPPTFTPTLATTVSGTKANPKSSPAADCGNITDIESFKDKNSDRGTCENWLTQDVSFKEAKHRCLRSFHGVKVKNYWCRKTCSGLLLESGTCFDFDDNVNVTSDSKTKKKRKKKRKRKRQQKRGESSSSSASTSITSRKSKSRNRRRHRRRRSSSSTDSVSNEDNIFQRGNENIITME